MVLWLCHTGEAGPLSDVDVAVLLDPAIAPQDRMAIATALVEKLERCCGRVDLVLLEEASPLLKDRVFRARHSPFGA